MTHKEALAGNTAGLLHSPCPGELVEHEAIAGVVVLRCPACETLIPTLGGRPVNAYVPFVCALAEKLDAKSLLPTLGGEDR